MTEVYIYILCVCDRRVHAVPCAALLPTYIATTSNGQLCLSVFHVLYVYKEHLNISVSDFIHTI